MVGAIVALPIFARALFPLPVAEAITIPGSIMSCRAALFPLVIVKFGDPPVIAFTVDGVIRGVPPAHLVRARVAPIPELGALLPFPFGKAV